MIKILSHIENPDLLKDIDAFISVNSPHSIFHKSLIFRLYADTKNITPYYIVSYDNGKINGIALVALIKSYTLGVFGKRLLINQLPVVVPDDKHTFNALLATVKQRLGKKVFYLEIRNIAPFSGFEDVLCKLGFKSQKRINRIINLGSNDAFNDLSESKRRQILKAQQQGVTLGDFAGINDVKAFYAILKKLYTRKVKKPLPDYTFFETAYNLSVTNPELHLTAVKYKGELIGGIVTIGALASIVYEWYVGGLHNSFKEQYPSVMATWGGILSAKAISAYRFDFMGGGLPNIPYGVREFKSRFGGEEQIIYRWQWSKYRLVFKFVKLIFKKIGI